MDFDPNVFLTDLLQRASPLLVPSIPAAMVAVKSIVSGIKVFVNRAKARSEKMRGNIIQTLAGVASLGVASAQAYMLGVFNVGFTAESVTGTLILAVIAWMGSMGVHDLFKDQNQLDVPSVPQATEADVRTELERARKAAEAGRML